MIQNSLLSPFAKTLLQLSKTYKSIQSQMDKASDEFEKKLLDTQRDKLWHIMGQCIRVIGDYIPNHASKKAVDYAKQNELGDIFKLRWSQQIKFEKKNGRKQCKLIQEHKTPVKNTINQLLTLENNTQVLELLLNQELFWIMKKGENDKLSHKNRPNPDEDYKHIKEIRNPYPIEEKLRPIVKTKNR